MYESPEQPGEEPTDAGQRHAVWSCDGCGIADRKNLRMSLKGESRFDSHPPDTILFCGQPFDVVTLIDERAERNATRLADRLVG